MNLAYGRNRGIPEDVTTAWGARLIAPADLVHDRQDLVAASSETKAELIAWLNGTPSGTGAIDKALKWLRTNYAWEMPETDEQVVLYEDELGIIVGSTQASHGYVYAAGWLKVHNPSGYELRKLRAIRRETEIGRAHDALTVERYEVQRMPITADRWHTHYGWSRDEADRFGESSLEVRVFAVYADGERRELEALAPVKGQAGQFEFGYGGSGPHETARAIVADRENADRTAAELKQLVPEVFVPAGRDVETLVINAAAVDMRRAQAAA